MSKYRSLSVYQRVSMHPIEFHLKTMNAIDAQLRRLPLSYNF